jgi:hypothetical protein
MAVLEDRDFPSYEVAREWDADASPREYARFKADHLGMPVPEGPSDLPPSEWRAALIRASFVSYVMDAGLGARAPPGAPAPP